MTKVIADKDMMHTVKSSLALEESIVSAEEIALFEDFEEISRSLSQANHKDEPVLLTSADALAGWGYDIAERLNSGEIDMNAVERQYRVDAASADSVHFMPVGEYELSLEREDLNQPWHEHIAHLEPARNQLPNAREKLLLDQTEQRQPPEFTAV